MSEEGLAYATIALAGVTFTLVIVTWIQARDTRKFQYANLVTSLHQDFFGKQRAIIASVEEGKPLLPARGGSFREYDLDDYLAYFELLASYWEEKLVPVMLIYWMFGHYIKKAWANEEIVGYV